MPTLNVPDTLDVSASVLISAVVASLDSHDSHKYDQKPNKYMLEEGIREGQDERGGKWVR